MTIDAIARGVAERFGVRLSLLRGPSRRASSLCPTHGNVSRSNVHRLQLDRDWDHFGGRDSATVRHACKAAALRLNADPTLAAAVASLEAAS